VKHKLFQILLSASFVTFCAVISAAQENPARTPRTQDAAQRPSAQDASTRAARAASNDAGQTRSVADETFELDISERRITEQNFNASTSVEAGEESARGLRLRIGVGVGAEQIDVLLRNVHGLVRFRGTLDRVLELINSRRTQETSP
jgi:hypothetical protein